MSVCICVATDIVETLSCPNCHVTFSDVDQLTEHSAGQCAAADIDGGRCSSELDDYDDRAVCAASSCSASAPDVDDSCRESRVTTGNVSDASQEVDAELDTDADDFTRPQLPQSSMRASPSFDEDSDHDDEHFDAPEMDAPGTGPQRLAVVEGHVVSDGRPSSKTSSSAATNVSQLIDNNVSPASKIAMLESVVYALHQQQMFQLELIEALRRQLATALAASSSRSGDDSNNTTLDLTLPRTSDMSVLDHGSSLSSLMRLSGAVDTRRGPPAGVQSPSTSPTALCGSMSDSHEAAVSSGWPVELALNKSRTPVTSLPSALLSTPTHGPPLADLSLFKKGE